MSARPGRIKLDRGVDIPHPRRDSVKTTPVFMELKAERTEQVRVQVRAAQAVAAAAVAGGGIAFEGPDWACLCRGP
jgi:hypothetical protein